MVKVSKAQKLMGLYGDASIEEIREGFAVLKRLFGDRQYSISTKFFCGQMVEFDLRRGVVVKGKVIKVNRTTIRVKADTGVYKVSPQLLRQKGK